MQHGERAGMMVPEEGRRYHRHHQHLRVADPSQLVALVPQGAHRLVNHHVDPYNVLGGHRRSPRSLLSLNLSEAGFGDDR